jgi:hypothetical protein
MFCHLFIFGETGTVNGTDNKIITEGRINFIQNIGLSFDSFGIFILLFNFGNLALNVGLMINLTYKRYQLKNQK